MSPAEDKMVCVCRNLRRRELVDTIGARGLRTFDQVRDSTGAANACGLCWQQVEQLLREIAADPGS